VTDFSEHKRRVRESWEHGNYSVIAESTLPASQALADACAISAGQEVLDVAAGTGNLALIAAREGAAVVASDLTPQMVEMGRARTEAEGYDVEWVVADAEALPFGDGRFDCCASVFGAMFAPRPEVAAAEMFRVVRPGGTVGLVSWTPDGFQGRIFAVGNKYVPPPDDVPFPSLWGDEEVARRRLDGLASSLTFERHSVRYEYESPEDWIEFMRNAGPTAQRMDSLRPEQRQAMRDDFFAVIDEFNQADDGSVLIDAEYLVIVARKRG
jgi:ubiquinone/menaquinone biosynthesis C-methylase UbiE